MKDWLFIVRMIPLAALLLVPAGIRAEAIELKVMSFNVWNGGAQAEANVISAIGADVIGIQEAKGTTATMANLLGMHYAVLPNTVGESNSTSILSRFPITATYDNGVRVDLGEHGDAYIFNVHLLAFPYQPYQLHPQSAELGWGPTINTGSHDADVQVAINYANSTRGADITAVLNEIATLVPAGAPVLLVGDFNEPSHLDWTAAAGPEGAGLHTHVVPWPTSIRVADAGFVDSYRAIYPDETTHWGYTWTTQFYDPEVHDRIDFVHYRGDGLILANVQLVGPMTAAGGQASDIQLSGYPSDHRAVLATFVVPEPGSAGALGLIGWLILRRRRRFGRLKSQLRLPECRRIPALQNFSEFSHLHCSGQRVTILVRQVDAR